MRCVLVCCVKNTRSLKELIHKVLKKWPCLLLVRFGVRLGQVRLTYNFKHSIRLDGNLLNYCQIFKEESYKFE